MENSTLSLKLIINIFIRKCLLNSKKSLLSFQIQLKNLRAEKKVVANRLCFIYKIQIIYNPSHYGLRLFFN